MLSSHPFNTHFFMLHLRQCCSDDIFTSINTYCSSDDCLISSPQSDEKITIPLPGHKAADDDDYDDIDLDSSDMYDEEEEEIEFDYKNIVVDSSFEVASRGDPRDATLYADAILQIVQKEEPDFVVEPKSIEKIQGPEILERRILLAEYLFNLAQAYPSPTTETIFQCISLLDRFLAVKKVPFEQLQLIGCCCMWISAKVELTSEDSLEPLRKLCHEKFSKQDFIQAESLILSGVNFKIHTITPYFFLRRFFKMINADEKIALLASYFCESTLMFVDLSCYRPSVVALCSVAAACLAIGDQTKVEMLAAFQNESKWDTIGKCFLHIIHNIRRVAQREKNCLLRKFGSQTIDGVKKGGLNLIKNVCFDSDLIRGLAKRFSSE